MWSLSMKQHFLIGVLVWATCAQALAEDFADFELDAPFVLEDDIPVVLTAARLKQPRAEVPASVTVIEAEHIRAWGVRTLPELMRFVPGMFIGHGDDENNASVAYHSANPNLMRRLQVLVDGRSVYRAGIAAVVWDDIPVALEDILRIEVTRGPNAAAYGANSFAGVINIVTKHPADSLGTHVRYRNGNHGVDDSYLSYSGQAGMSSFRITANLQADSGFDGDEAKKDEWRDSRRHGFVSAYVSRQLQPETQLNLHAAIKQGHTDIRQNLGAYQEPPDQETKQYYVWSKLQHDHSATHQSHLQAYVSVDDRQQGVDACVPTFLLDPDLYNFYSSNPDAVNELIGGVTSGQSLADVLTPEYLGALSAEEQGYLSNVIARVSADADNFSEVSCGDIDYDTHETRIDVEWQDTVQWSPQIRTVYGLSFRRDQVDSETFFDGVRRNDTFRAFINAEWRITDSLVSNIGAMYEDENANDDAVSPRIALNWLLTPQQSIRLVHSRAVRSPDMLEQQPDYNITLHNSTDNYLGAENPRYYMHQVFSNRGLGHERIASNEIGYYGLFPTADLEVDFKVYRDRMWDLISNPINLETLTVRSDTEMVISGAEMQLQWKPGLNDRLWATAAYVDTHVRLGDTTGVADVENLFRSETRLSSENSMVVSWTHTGRDWSTTASHLWADSYNHGRNNYRRFELNGRKSWEISSLTIWTGLFWQHRISNDRINYTNQVYSDRNSYYLNVGMDF